MNFKLDRMGFIGFVIFVVFTGFAYADEDVFVEAKIREGSKHWDVSYPGRAYHANRSGSVELIFMVDIAGKVKEVVAGAHTHEMFIKPAIKALKKYQYTPATINGEPVDSRLEKVFSFSGRFLNSKVVKNFNEQFRLFGIEFNKAEPNEKKLRELLMKMDGARQSNPSIQAVLNYAHMLFAEKFLSLNEKIEAAYVVDNYKLRGLSKIKFIEVRQKLVSWLVYAKRYGEVEAVIRRFGYLLIFDMPSQPYEFDLNEVEYYWKSIGDFKSTTDYLGKLLDKKAGPLARTIEKIYALEISDKSFESTIEVGHRGYVLRGLLMRKFRIEQLTGELSELSFRCDAIFKRVPFSNNEEYSMPKKWGKCNVQISGVVGSTARLTEGDTALVTPSVD